MTQQYIVGEFSSLLGLCPAPGGSLSDALRGLRRQVEVGPASALPRLAGEALDLADAICWATLDQGDAETFGRCAGAAGALREFVVSASLLP